MGNTGNLYTCGAINLSYCHSVGRTPLELLTGVKIRLSEEKIVVIHHHGKASIPQGSLNIRGLASCPRK